MPSKGKNKEEEVHDEVQVTGAEQKFLGPSLTSEREQGRRTDGKGPLPSGSSYEVQNITDKGHIKNKPTRISPSAEC